MDGQTSTETEMKLLGIARGSNQELLEDYQDYLKRKGMTEWFGKNERFDRLHRFCQEHILWEDYRPLTERMNDEELAPEVLEIPEDARENSKVFWFSSRLYVPLTFGLR